MSVPLMLGLACALIGALAARRLQRRSAYLRAWQRALIAMHAASAYARANCAQILRAGASEARELIPVARAVELEGADAEKRYLDTSARQPLKAEERTVLLSVMRALSSGGREEIGAALAYAIERFRQFCADCDRRRDADARMYMTLGVLSGLCVFLILE